MTARHSPNDKMVAVLLTVLLILWPSLGAAQSQTSAPPQEAGNPTEAASQSPEQLQALVAPIALYPDSLVAQILTAATFPDQIAVADYWVQQNKNLTGSALMQTVDKQSWDPSVKALTEFPSVLDNLAKNLPWTSPWPQFCGPVVFRCRCGQRRNPRTSYRQR